MWKSVKKKGYCVLGLIVAWNKETWNYYDN